MKLKFAYVLLTMVLLVTIPCFAQTKIFVNKTGAEKRVSSTMFTSPDRYYLIFSFHGRYSSPDPKLNSYAGHAWVMWGKDNAQTHQSEIMGYGFWPDRNTTEANLGSKLGNYVIGTTIIPTQFLGLSFPGRVVGALQIGAGGSWGSVPGQLQKDLFGTEYVQTLKQFVIEVDQDEFNQSLNLLESYKDGNPNYKLVEKDCVSFLIDVGTSIGIDMPKRSLLNPSSITPMSYMELFQKQITEPNSVSLITRSENITAKMGNLSLDKSGNYSVVFDLTGKDRNTCSIDQLGNQIEEKFRDGELTCKTINYPNGDSWYSETQYTLQKSTAGPLQQYMPKMDPVSEYSFANGNTILAYNPLKFNPVWVPMKLSSGTDDYLGSINLNGVPSGNGTIRHFVNGFINSTKTGIFIDGKFSSFTGVRVENKVIYGENVNGQLSGPGRLEYDNGDVFTGTFINNNAEGLGTLTNSRTGDFLSGSFVHGLPNGFCTSRTSLGLFKGEFKDGKCQGNGSWWKPNGTLFEGNFNNGKLTTGKATLSNGEYYVGNFDSKGNPDKGKFYDKSGKEKSSRERGEGAGGNIDHKPGNDFCTGVEGGPMVCGPGSFK
ncbi:hypothetical protein [Pedobacter sp. HMWF019]|uniref:hypothetical protein n=1 Tax=Pedobacter sp. HMWF019 TaxID=2056856 RepID=UPI0011B239BE|nr:hypothetical protein [Pedobacter sp. HMWF019]